MKLKSLKGGCRPAARGHPAASQLEAEDCRRTFFGEAGEARGPAARVDNQGRGIIVAEFGSQALRRCSRTDVNCWRTCLPSCPRWVTWTKAQTGVLSTRRTCCSPIPRRPFSSRSSGPVADPFQEGVGVFFCTQLPGSTPLLPAGAQVSTRCLRYWHDFWALRRPCATENPSAT